MIRYLSVLERCPLFADISAEQLESLFSCLDASEKSFTKNEFIFLAGQPAVSVGIVLSGSVTVLHEDFWGNRSILMRLGPGNLFAEAFSCAGNELLPVSAIADEKTAVMLINCRRIIKTCSTTCIFHTSLIKNLLGVLAERNILLTRKIEHLTKHSTREKLLSYLSSQAQATGRSRFDIPFNRQELADYLSVDRSAMSSELGKMRDEGLLKFERNHFELFSVHEHSSGDFYM
ncbi:MAG: Crp/Fnr family transcriptional regulator [Clostridiales bacterium]|nr:Crp/Fnr family transcriptional regulator [Clostridiales bacterium]